MIAKPHDQTKVKKIIGVVSGKGGVGKSLVTSLLTIAMQIKGYKCAILDADVTGPSIPRSFGIFGQAEGSESGIIPKESATGIKVMSTNLLLPEETTPVVWRGPVIAGVVKQFWTDVIWGDIDFMFVDMPPGTGDVPLTVYQSLPIDGIVIVSTPQELVEMIIKKAANMANMMNVPILGMVENMSYLNCPHCNEKIEIYGKSKIDAIASEYGVKTVAKLPINPEISSAVDAGAIETVDVSPLSEFVEMLASL
jgi:Mrp family chromosome partitioning ATPase